MLEEKTELRNSAKVIRSELDIPAISRTICNNLQKLLISQNSKSVLAYMAFNSEVDVSELFQLIDYRWHLPKIADDKKTLNVFPYRQGEKLEKNRWGILEPIPSDHPSDPKSIDTIIIPALMADLTGHRLGYGAGFYDRLLKRTKKSCLKITIVPEALLAENLPVDEWDVSTDFVVTEKNIYKI